MPPLLRHAEYSRPHLLRLLADLDAAEPGEGRMTLSLPPQANFPPLDLPADFEQAVAEQARRSPTGVVAFFGGDAALIVGPPYPVRDEFLRKGTVTQPLRELLAWQPYMAAILLRLGGYAIGIYQGDTLVEARNDTRFVKNRHRKGGQSQRRFDRIREKQTHELFDKLCEEVKRRLPPRAAALDFVVYGGDTHTFQAFLKECPYLSAFPAPLLERFLTVPEPRHETLTRLPVLLGSSRVTTIKPQA